ncbi:MAG: HIT family protein [Candidatus Obscuribacterales bacterium]|nr:HIT family protein [Candidatus Obscuribacterales bacterium]
MSNSIDRQGFQEDCPFCTWLAKKSPTPPIVWQDDSLIATLCESPISRGHVQVVFKRHYSELAHVAGDDAARFGRIIPLLSQAIKSAMEAEIVYVACISEEVKHIHFHLVPRYAGETKGFALLARERQPLEAIDETIKCIQNNLLALK